MLGICHGHGNWMASRSFASRSVEHGGCGLVRLPQATSERSMPMTATRLATSVTAFLLLAASAAAEPAYVGSTVNLRAGAGTSNPIVAKIPGGSLVDASNCSEWCEVDWQGRKGFAIASALDRSGRVPGPRTAARRSVPPPAAYIDDDLVQVDPPLVYGGPYYYGYGYRPYYRGYRSRWGYGYRGYRGYRRW
jgi:hypothetical protein